MKHKSKVSSAAAQAMAANDMRVALEANNAGILKSLDICIPVCVYSYDREKHKVTVLPLIKQAYYNGKWKFVSRQPFEVSIRSIQCGGFCMDFPIFIGDTGWVFSSDRDTYFLRDENSPTHIVLGKDRDVTVVEDVLPQPAKQPKIHSLLDGFFIPDNWGKWEYQRFKDSDDLDIKNSFYLGTSFYDEDELSKNASGGGNTEKDKDDKEEDESDADDDSYEGNASASLVFSRKGAAYLLASSKESSKKKTKLKVNKDGIDIEIENGDEEKSNGNDKNKVWNKISMVLSPKKGIDINCTGDVQTNTFKIDSNGLEMKYKSGASKDNEKKDAILTIGPNLDINIISPGDIKLSAGSVSTECNNITVLGKDTTFNIDNLTGLASAITINASSNISLRSLGSISLASSNSVNIGTVGSLSVGTMGGNMSVQTNGGSINLKSGGGSIKMDAGNASISCGDNGVSIVGNSVSINGNNFSLNTNIGESNGKQFISGGRLVLT